MEVTYGMDPISLSVPNTCEDPRLGTSLWQRPNAWSMRSRTLQIPMRWIGPSYVNQQSTQPIWVILVVVSGRQLSRFKSRSTNPQILRPSDPQILDPWTLNLATGYKDRHVVDAYAT